MKKILLFVISSIVIFTGFNVYAIPPTTLNTIKSNIGMIKSGDPRVARVILRGEDSGGWADWASAGVYMGATPILQIYNTKDPNNITTTTARICSRSLVWSEFDIKLSSGSGTYRYRMCSYTYYYPGRAYQTKCDPIWKEFTLDGASLENSYTDMKIETMAPSFDADNIYFNAKFIRDNISKNGDRYSTVIRWIIYPYGTNYLENTTNYNVPYAEYMGLYNYSSSSKTLTYIKPLSESILTQKVNRSQFLLESNNNLITIPGFQATTYSDARVDNYKLVDYTFPWDLKQYGFYKSDKYCVRAFIERYEDASAFSQCDTSYAGTLPGIFPINYVGQEVCFNVRTGQIISYPNKTPLIVSAGQDQRILSGKTITFNNATTSQPLNININYTWECKDSAGKVISGLLSATNILKPIFTAPIVTSQTKYYCTLTAKEISK